jgi:hypothetical protein
MNLFFQRSVVGGLFFCNSLLLGTLAMIEPVVAQERTSQAVCGDAINEANARILNGRTIALQTRLLDLSDNMGYPGDRSQGVNFTMASASGLGSTPDGDMVLTSPVFMKSIATDIIEQCPSFSYVVFAAANSGWQIPFGLINGEVEAFRCREVTIRERRSGNFSMPWGFYDCST